MLAVMSTEAIEVGFALVPGVRLHIAFGIVVLHPTVTL
jgi:hypothetical protein